MNDTTVEVSDAPGSRRYEARVDGRLAGIAQYRTSDGVITLTHTEVQDEYEGRGVGSALARFALDDARERGLQVDPQCPFIRSWIDQHDDYAYLVA